MKKILSAISIGVFALVTSNSTHAADMMVTSVAPISTQNSQAIPVLDIESDILSMQKDLVGIIRQAVNYYSQGDIKESGDLNFNFEYTGSGSSGKVKLNLEKYVNILSVMTGNQELHFVATANVDIKEDNYADYDEKTNAMTYSAENISATVKADVSFKIIGDDLFVTLNSLTKDRTGTDKMTKSFDSSFKEFPLVEGKTVRIPLGKNNHLNQAEILKKTNAVLAILEQDPLLTPKSKKFNGYQLGLKRTTMQKINLAIGEKKNANMSDIGTAKTPLLYTKTGDTTTLSVNEVSRSSKTRTALVRKAGAYEFQLDEQGIGSKRKTSSASVRISKDAATIHVKDANETFDLDWSNNMLTAKRTWKDYSWDASTDKNVWNTLTIAGPLSYTNADLKFGYNGAEVGHIKITTSDKNLYTFDLGMSIDLYGNYKASLIGNELIEFGTFPVDKPTEFTDFKK